MSISTDLGEETEPEPGSPTDLGEETEPEPGSPTDLGEETEPEPATAEPSVQKQGREQVQEALPMSPTAHVLSNDQSQRSPNIDKATAREIADRIRISGDDVLWDAVPKYLPDMAELLYMSAATAYSKRKESEQKPQAESRVGTSTNPEFAQAQSGVGTSMNPAPKPAPKPEDEDKPTPKPEDEDTLSSSGSRGSTPPGKDHISSKKRTRFLYEEGERPAGRRWNGRRRRRAKKKAKGNKKKKEKKKKKKKQNEGASAEG